MYLQVHIGFIMLNYQFSCFAAARFFESLILPTLKITTDINRIIRYKSGTGKYMATNRMPIPIRECVTQFLQSFK